MPRERDVPRHAGAAACAARRGPPARRRVVPRRRALVAGRHPAARQHRQGDPHHPRQAGPRRR
jgi:hypothetical protein